ncbi:unnamed protein product [Fraxinus pennsylvanica]|uniref:Uncharacterized protein n=1 Tax=Fraxinus pennsylvanica TaxID=56036 RepID=A0AAD2EBJ2_9LAMI|nr:unnamed protein product [Fraxinus pennsylvanica]
MYYLSLLRASWVFVRQLMPPQRSGWKHMSLIIDEDLLEEVWAMAIVARSCHNPKSTRQSLIRYILKALENPLKVVREENSSSALLERCPLEDLGMLLHSTVGGVALPMW